MEAQAGHRASMIGVLRIFAISFSESYHGDGSWHADGRRRFDVEIVFQRARRAGFGKSTYQQLHERIIFRRINRYAKIRTAQ